MKKKFLVISIQNVLIKAADGTEMWVWLQFDEGVFDHKIDAEARLADMIAEEKKNNDEMYFDIKEVYSK